MKIWTVGWSQRNPMGCDKFLIRPVSGQVHLLIRVTSVGDHVLESETWLYAGDQLWWSAFFSPGFFCAFLQSFLLLVTLNLCRRVWFEILMLRLLSWRTQSRTATWDFFFFLHFPWLIFISSISFPLGPNVCDRERWM